MSDRATMEVTAAWEKALANRRVLDVRPERVISVKRDVHELHIDTDPAAFADAFHTTMRTPGVRFGTLQVLRPRHRAGAPFELGDRFQGRFNLVRLLQGHAPWLAGRPGAQRLLDRIADHTASDYGMLDLLELDGRELDGTPTWRFRYRYLEGSPIAGSSTFIVQPGPAGTRLTQVFVYQELRPEAAAFFSIFGLKIHNQVVYDQTWQSASRLGASIVRSDIPDAYLPRRN